MSKESTTGRLNAGTAMSLPQIARLAPGPTFVIAPTGIASRHMRARQRTPEEARQDQLHLRLSKTVEDVIRSMVRREGDIVRVLEVKPRDPGYWRSIVIRMLVYGKHGVPMKAEYTFDLCVRGDIDEDGIPKRLENQFGKMLQRQKVHGEAQGGPVREWSERDIDLSKYRIEIPVWRYIHSRLGDGTQSFLRRMLLAGSDSRAYQMRVTAGVDMGDLEISTSRNMIRGRFMIVEQGQTMTWAKGALKVKGLQLTEMLCQSFRGERIDQVVRHPLLEGDMIISAAEPSMKIKKVVTGAGTSLENGTVSTVFMLRDTDMAIPV